MITTGPTLYKRDTTGRVRTWRMEIDGGTYRTVSGLKDGGQVESGWTICEPTNVGRSNERGVVQQAVAEVEAMYQHQLSREYHETEAQIDNSRFFEPMLAKKFEKFEPGFAQPKLDGVRCIARASGLSTREGKPITSCPHIMEALADVFAADPDLTLDGELYNHDFKDDFNQIISLVRKQNAGAEHFEKTAKLVQYWIYDLPSHPGPFSARTKALEAMWEADDTTIIVDVDTFPVATAEDFTQLHGEWLEAGYEGSMWRADALYEQKRSKTLQKRKEFQDAEFEVVSIEEGLGNWAGAAKRVTCRLPDGREFGAGIAGTYERGKQLLHEKHNIVTIKFFMLTPDGIPRFGVAVKWHGEARTM